MIVDSYTLSAKEDSQEFRLKTYIFLTASSVQVTRIFKEEFSFWFYKATQSFKFKIPLFHLVKPEYPRFHINKEDVYSLMAHLLIKFKP